MHFGVNLSIKPPPRYQYEHIDQCIQSLIDVRAFFHHRVAYGSAKYRHSYRGQGETRMYRIVSFRSRARQREKPTPVVTSQLFCLTPQKKSVSHFDVLVSAFDFFNSTGCFERFESKPLSRAQEVGHEEFGAVFVVVDDVVLGWSPCPRCTSTRIEQIEPIKVRSVRTEGERRGCHHAFWWRYGHAFVLSMSVVFSGRLWSILYRSR